MRPLGDKTGEISGTVAFVNISQMVHVRDKSGTSPFLLVSGLGCSFLEDRSPVYLLLDRP